MKIFLSFLTLLFISSSCLSAGIGDGATLTTDAKEEKPDVELVSFGKGQNGAINVTFSVSGKSVTVIDDDGIFTLVTLHHMFIQGPLKDVMGRKKKTREVEQEKLRSWHSIKEVYCMALERVRQSILKKAEYGPSLLYDQADEIDDVLRKIRASWKQRPLLRM